jgi:hypothetical protein
MGFRLVPDREGPRGARRWDIYWGKAVSPAARGARRREYPRSKLLTEDCFVSIVRVGLAETKNFGEGYEAIFGKKKGGGAKKEKPAAKAETPKKKKKAKKK